MQVLGSGWGGGGGAVHPQALTRLTRDLFLDPPLDPCPPPPSLLVLLPVLSGKDTGHRDGWAPSSD